MYNDAYSGTGSPTFNKVTFSGNTATGDGGAIYNDAYTGTSSPTFNNVTFSGNSAGFDRGGAMYNFSYANGLANPVMTNVILWDNGTSPIVNKHGATSELHDSVLQGSCPGGSTCSGNMVYTDPLLGPLHDNGGATQTMLPGVGSPAINAGNDTTCEGTDQRGVTRPQNGQCDIGAVEILPDSIFANGFEV